MVKRITNQFYNKLQQVKYKRQYGSIFDSNVYMDRTTDIRGYVNIEENTKLFGCSLEEGSDIGSNNLWQRCSFGRYCVIGSNCKNIVGHHPTSFFVAMNSKFYKPQGNNKGFTEKQLYKDEYKYADKEKRYFNIIGNDVYLTDSIIILEGVKIGDGAVITPGSVVTKNVPPYAIVRGNPAKVEAYRFSEENIEFLKKLKWWEKDEKWIKDHVCYFSNIKELKRVVNEEGIKL